MRDKRDKDRSKKTPKKLPVILVLGGIVLLLSAFLVKGYLFIDRSFFRRLDRPTFVLASGKSQIIVFSFQGDQGLILSFSSKEKISATRGFGEYELAKIYPLGELDKKGGQLLQESVQEHFAIPVFGYFYDESGFDYLTVSPGNFFSKIIFNSLKGSLKTDLQFWDLFVLGFKLRRLNEEKVSKTVFTGGVGEFFKDKSIRNESYSIEVLNSTSHSGLASRAAKILEQAGARVVRTSEIAEKHNECLISASQDKLQSYTVSWLKKVFNCRTKKMATTDNRTDIALIVGKDYWKKLGEKW